MTGPRIIAGSIKGRTIPFTNSRFDNADITPQRVKEALFSILGGSLHGTSFLDLFACSGQIGFEAVSRGAKPVVMNEPDLKRRKFIQTCVKDWGFEGVEVPGLGYEAAMKNISKRGMVFDNIYLDPPYEKTSGGVEIHAAMLLLTDELSLLADDGTAVIQHYSKNTMPASAGRLTLHSTKKYGDTSLSIYRL
jgi:16S rRNA (guanine966-N2)-methyltransferase